MLYGFTSVADLLNQQSMSVERFKTIADVITVRSDVFTIQCLATADVSGARFRTECVVDRSMSPGTILILVPGSKLLMSKGEKIPHSVIAAAKEDARFKAVEVRRQDGRIEVVWTKSLPVANQTWSGFAAECGLASNTDRHDKTAEEAFAGGGRARFDRAWRSIGSARRPSTSTRPKPS